jgi:DNA-binding transcriptional LysR family regulator
MELQQLKYFREVAEREHVTRAAEKLFVSQSAISRAVTQLEEEVGVPLFYRQGRAVVLSRYGRLFLEYVNRALSILESGKRLLREQSGEESGTVSLGFLHSLGIEMVPRLIKEYCRKHPKIHAPCPALRRDADERACRRQYRSMLVRPGNVWAKRRPLEPSSGRRIVDRGATNAPPVVNGLLSANRRGR